MSFIDPQRKDQLYPEFFRAPVDTTLLVSLLMICHYNARHPNASFRNRGDLGSQDFLDTKHGFSFCSSWNLIREADRRRKGGIVVGSLLSPHLRVFTFRVIGKTFDTRLKEAEIRFEKFIIKTEKVLSRGLDLGYAFSQKRLLSKLEEQAAGVIFGQVVAPLQVSANRLGSFESM